MNLILKFKKLCVLWLLRVVVSASDTGGFLFTAPKTFLSGSDNFMCISFRNASNIFKIEVKILKPKEDVEIASFQEILSENIQAGKCFRIFVPITKIRNGRLHLIIQLKTGENFNINYVEQILMRPDPTVTFIQTDKPVYSGGQLLQFRVFSLKSNLTPARESIKKIWIENPSGIHLMQWLNESTSHGILNKSYLLSDEPLHGKWLIKVKKENENIISQPFLVDKYALPKFLVVIKSSENFTTSGTITVCAKYIFGEPVHGDVTLQYFIKCSFSYYCQKNESATIRRFNLNRDGCISHEIILKNLPYFTKTLFLNASVTESGTGRKAEASHKIEIRTSKHKFTSEFSSETKKKKFKPGLPFKGEIILQPQANRNQQINICLLVNDIKNCRQFMTNENHIEFTILPFSILDSNNFTASIRAKVLKEVNSKDENSEIASPEIILNLVPWYSPSGSYIRVEKVFRGRLKCGEKAIFNIIYSITDSPIRFYYMVKSKGIIVKNDVIDVFHAKFFESKEGDNPINHGDLNMVKQLEFNFTVLPNWFSRAYLLVYFIRHDGEVIADSLAMTIEKCLSNKVKTKWEKNLVPPGFKNHLKIEASRDSICALTVVDKSAYSEPSFNLINLENLFENLYQNSAVPFHSSNDPCPKREDTALQLKERHSRFEDSLHAFTEFGVLVITDLNLGTKPCQNISEDVLTTNATTRISKSNDLQLENTMIFNPDESLDKNVANFEDTFFDGDTRIYFPETWVWNLLDMNDSESVDMHFKVPDTITEWTTETVCLSPKNGLGIAENSKFVTYKPFFLDFFVPQSLNRKEVFHLHVSVFNFESTDLPIKITHHSSVGFVLKSAKVASYCVRSKSKIIHRFVLEAVKLGEANISVSADIDTSYSGNCGNVVSIRRDLVIKKTVIRYEGLPVVKVKSGFICGNNPSFDREVKWNIKVPTKIIDNSISLSILVAGDILGPAIKNLDHLITLPTGCGEQNMLLLVPNILLLDYLIVTKSRDEELVENALKNLDLGYQRQLNYKRRDHSYSAFGEEDSRGSIWLTAFVVRYISQAKKYIYIDSKNLNSSVSWIIRQQMENGCFPMIGKIYHRNLQEKILEEDYLKILTAYVLIALIESGVSKDNLAIKNAIYCLKPNRESLGTYGDLLSAYALISAGEFRDSQALMLEILKEAKRSYRMLWWENEESIESSIEMTAYGILTLIKLGGSHFLAAATDALRWIIQYRNQNGGFISSQDTVVALEAISKFAATIPAVNEGSLSLIARTPEKAYTFNITEKNKMLQQKINLPSFTTDIHFTSSGTGCALVQTYLRYNVRNGNPNDHLKIQLKIHSLSDFVLNFMAKFEICVKFDSSENKIDMAVLEVFMISGYYPDRASLYAIRTSRKGVRRWEEYEEKVNFYFENLKRKKICVKFTVVQEACIENAAPATIKLYNYYDSRQQTTMKYNLTSYCQNSSFNDFFDIDEIKPLKMNLKKRAINNPFKFKNSSNNFVDLTEDLETPFGIEGIIPAYILPPRPGGKNCPHCLHSIPKMFHKFYCSSKIALKVRNMGQKILEFQYDVSPRKNFTILEKNITFNVKDDCDCFLLKSVNTSALMLVLPSRAFDLDEVKNINADDSLQLYPWENSNGMPKYLKEAVQNCQKWPFYF